MKKIGLLSACLLIWIGVNGQIPNPPKTAGEHLVRSAEYKLAAYGFGIGGAGLYLVADYKVNHSDPGTIGAYKILRWFSLGCVAAGLTFELCSTVHLFKAGKLLISPTGTG